MCWDFPKVPRKSSGRKKKKSKNKKKKKFSKCIGDPVSGRDAPIKILPKIFPLQHLLLQFSLFNHCSHLLLTTWWGKLQTTSSRTQKLFFANVFFLFLLIWKRLTDLVPQVKCQNTKMQWCRRTHMPANTYSSTRTHAQLNTRARTCIYGRKEYQTWARTTVWKAEHQNCWERNIHKAACTHTHTRTEAWHYITSNSTWGGGGELSRKISRPRSRS